MSTIPKLLVNDDAEIDDVHYFLSKQNGEWAVRHDGEWKPLPDANYAFVYLGPVVSPPGKSRWRVMRKAGTPKFENRIEADGSKFGLITFNVVAKINKHTEVFSVEARDKEHAYRLAMSDLSKRVGIPIPALRSMVLRDGIKITPAKIK